MFKNTSGQKIQVYAFDSTTNLPKTGDAANLTCYVSINHGAATVLTDTSAAEIDSTNAKGYYLFDVSQAETNGDTLLFTCKSSTADIVVIAVPAVVYTRPPYFSTLGIASDGDLVKVNTLDGHTPQTGDSYARLGAPAGASVSADVAAVKAQTAAIETDTQDLQTQVGTAGAGLAAVPWNAAWDAEVQSEVTDALNAYDPPTNAEMVARTIASADYALEATLTAMKGATFDTSTDSLEAIRNRGDSAWATATGFSTHSAADVVTALGTGSSLTALATAAALQTVDDEIAIIDGIVDAIKAKTDSLTFTVSGQVDANAESMNGAEILGNGTSGNLWRGE